MGFYCNMSFISEVNQEALMSELPCEFDSFLIFKY